MGLVEKYNMLLSKYNFMEKQNANIAREIMRDSLVRFVSDCSNPAIWCYGRHTRYLMADYVFEMKKVKYIIDKNHEKMGEGGYHIIGGEQIEKYNIDGIIISTRLYREEIKAFIKQNYPDIPYLDFYEELEKRGIVLEKDYYIYDNPYKKYQKINRLKREKWKSSEREKIEMEILNEYINMMDFRSAIEYIEELRKRQDCQELKRDLEELYHAELAAVSGISENNVLMFCIDGLSRQYLSGNDMPHIKKYLESHTRLYTNAYSTSTSTYESLIPAFSENNDMRSKYYETNVIAEQDCRFIREAVKQDRNIYFYADAKKLVESEKIKYTRVSQSATEKIWNFAVDAETEENGLFYIHVLFESHYPFANPDTEAELVITGAGMLEDYLEKNGGRLQGDYVQQHTDAVRYLDRVLSPFLERIPCRFVFFADHGCPLVPYEAPVEAFPLINFTAAKAGIEVPLAIKSPEMPIGSCDNLMSLMSLSEIICSLLKKESFIEPKNDFVKIQRSELYNPVWHHFAKKLERVQELNAFEGFVFEDGRKLVVYANGFLRLWDQNDEPIEEQDEKEKLFHKIKDYITVTDCV